MDFSALAEMPFDRLLNEAAQIANSHFGNVVELCSIISIRSGQCGMDCKFCIQNRNNNFVGKPMCSEATLLERIERLARLPIAHIGLVASGAALAGRDFDSLCAAIAKTSDLGRAKLCVSLGRLSKTQMETLKQLGIRRCHHNLETSETWYPRICSTQTWRQRKQTVETALETGLEVCSGALFGIGECWRDRIALAKSLGSMGVKYIPLNFLQPQPGTSFASNAPLAAEEALRIIAVYRHLLPDAMLRICGGRPLVFGKRQADLFKAGANALMTGNYLTTAGLALDADLALLKQSGMRNATRDHEFKNRQ